MIINIKTALYQFARISVILVPLCLLLSATAVVAANVTLRWDANDPAPEGYRVFTRKSDQAYNYSQPDWEGAGVTCTLNHLEGDTEYYFVVRAYDGSQQSADSAEAHFRPPLTDNDSDGIPDDWEAHFGLNPLDDNADGDLDRDGISNRDEFRAGLEPDDKGIGTAPLPPELLFPESNSQVETNPLLQVGEFSDVDGDAHIATQWQVFDTQSEDCLMDVVTDRWRNLLRVPLLLLNGDRTYHWRARFFDSGGRASAWSAIDYFTTQAVADDQDGNRIPDDQEGGTVEADVARSLTSPAVYSEPTGQEGGAVEADVARSLTPLTAYSEPTGMVAASVNTISEIEQVALMDPAQFEIDETTPARLPSAMLAYKLVLFQPGQRALVTIHLSDPAPAGATWIKHDDVNGWQDYSHHAAISADRWSVTVEVKDGGYGDADGVANGIIIDPAGLAPAAPGASTTASAGGGGGGGCFIASVHNADKGINAAHGPWQWVKDHMHRLLPDLISH